MDPLTGVWRLVDARAWDAEGRRLAPPWGDHPIGQITFANGRVLAALCNGDAATAGEGRAYSSYGGRYVFDGATLAVYVDVASDPGRIGGEQVREVVLTADELILRPPMRRYGGETQQRELVWKRIWRPAGDTLPPK